jgi:hypothetical protein
MFHTREHVRYQVVQISAWLLFAIAAISTTGCAAWTKVRERAVEDRRQVKEAFAQLADPYGGAVSSRAGEIERSLAETEPTLP